MPRVTLISSGSDLATVSQSLSDLGRGDPKSTHRYTSVRFFPCPYIACKPRLRIRCVCSSAVTSPCLDWLFDLRIDVNLFLIEALMLNRGFLDCCVLLPSLCLPTFKTKRKE